MATKKRKAEAAAETAKPTYVVVDDRGLNVRSGPGKDYPVVRVAPCGCALTPVGKDVNGWIPLEDGWVMALYVAVLNAPPVEG